MINPIASYRCHKCGTLVPVDTSVVLTYCPPQYSYCCPNCEYTSYVFCSDVTIQSKDVCTLCDGATYPPKDQRILQDLFAITSKFQYNIYVKIRRKLYEF